MAKKKSKLSTLKKRVWRLASEYNRRKDADTNGNTTCKTCGKFGHWRDFDAGHFIAKGNGNSVYFIDDNIHAQCRRCNSFDEGNKENYYPYMLERYGQERVDELKVMKHQPLKITREDYAEMEANYKNKIRALDDKSN